MNIKSNTVLGRVLAIKRRDAGLTQEYIAFKCKKSRQQMQKVENGDRELTVSDLMNYLEIIDDPLLYLQTINCITGLYGIEGLERDEANPIVYYFLLNRSYHKALINLRKYQLLDKSVERESVNEAVFSLVELSKIVMGFVTVICDFYDVKISEIKREIKKVDCESTLKK